MAQDNPLPQTYPEPLERETLTELTSMLFDHIEAQIQFADTKAQLTLAADALLAASLTFFGDGGAFSTVGASSVLGVVVLTTLNVLTVTCLLLSVYFAVAVARPILTSTAKRDSLFFFGHIVAVGPERFVEEFQQQNYTDAHEALLRQIHAKSAIAMSKFKGMKRSLDFLVLTLILWVLDQFATALLT